MSGAPQVAMWNASQIWQIFFPSQTLQVFCFSFAKPSDFLFGPSQKGTICSSDCCTPINKLPVPMLGKHHAHLKLPKVKVATIQFFHDLQRLYLEK
jgi:hypothetical protein